MHQDAWRMNQELASANRVATKTVVSLLRQRHKDVFGTPMTRAELVKEIWKEDLDGRLELCNADIGFLKPYMNWWLSGMPPRGGKCTEPN